MKVRQEEKQRDARRDYEAALAKARISYEAVEKAEREEIEKRKKANAEFLCRQLKSGEHITPCFCGVRNLV